MEVPLSLQVFHSSNEYKAHRRNRTEQLRLEDVRTVLKREEKLYVKEYSLHRNKLSAHYSRRFSFPSSIDDRRNSVASSTAVAQTRFSHTSSASVFSAPAKLQRDEATSNNGVMNSDLVAQLSTSLRRLSTSTRFQRIQRQFSIASFTENGRLTNKGITMSKKIDKARDILFRRKPLLPCSTSQSNTKSIAHKSTLDLLRENGEVQLCNHNVNQCREKSTQSPETESLQNQPMKDARQIETTENLTQIKEENNDHEEVTQIQTLNAINSPATEAFKSDSVDTGVVENESTTLSASKKRVKIKKEVYFQTTDDETNIQEICQQNNFENPHLGEDEEPFDWSSIFTRHNTAPKLDPLQDKIKTFLADQHIFNRAFPKGDDIKPEIDDLQRELSQRAAVRKESERQESKRKNEIVVEVLHTLGVKDRHILAHYDIDVEDNS